MEILRVGLIAILIKDRESSAQKVNSLLSNFGHVIVGRMGIPYEKRKVFLISLMVDGTTDEIGALTGKIGMIQGVSVKSNLVQIPEEECQIWNIIQHQTLMTGLIP